MAIVAAFDGKARAWQALLMRAEGANLHQGWAYGEALRDEGRLVHRLVLHRPGGGMGIAQLIERRLPFGVRLVMLLRGPLMLDGAAPAGSHVIDALHEALDRPFLLWSPESAPGPVPWRRVMTGYSTIRLALDRPIEQIRAGLHGKWRNMLRRGEQAGLDVRVTRGGPDLAWLIERNEQHRRAARYRGLGPGFFHALAVASRATAGQTILIARQDGQPVAGVMLQHNGPNASYEIGYCGEQGRAARAGHLLLWEAIRRLHRQGCRSLDLGGVDTVNAPGLARFKLGLGGKLVTLDGTWLLPPRLRLFRSKARRAAPCGAALPTELDQGSGT